MKMTEKKYFEDLTNYTHQITPFVMDGVGNIGWLNIFEKFPVGDVPTSTLRKLKLVAGGTGTFQPLVDPLRESPICQLCGELELLDANGRVLPNAEIWIPSNKCIYASPIKIIHLIEVHKYCPPEEYIAAIDSLDLNSYFFADAVYREKLIESGWFNRVR